MNAWQTNIPVPAAFCQREAEQDPHHFRTSMTRTPSQYMGD